MANSLEAASHAGRSRLPAGRNPRWRIFPVQPSFRRSFLGLGCALFAVVLISGGDAESVKLLAQARVGWLSRMMFGITALGEFTWIASLTLGVVVMAWAWGKWPLAIPFGLAVAGTSLTVALTKLLVARQRPPVAAILEPSFSFPSGHAALAAVTYGYLMYVAWRATAARSRRVLALMFGVVTVLAVGFSRIYFGVHYPSDVVAGYLVGVVWLAVTIQVTSAPRSSPSPMAAFQPISRPWRRLVTAVVVVVLLAVYVALVSRAPNYIWSSIAEVTHGNSRH